MKWVGVAEPGCSQDPQPQVSDPQVGGISQPQSQSLRREGSKPHIVLPSQGVLHQKLSSQNIWL